MVVVTAVRALPQSLADLLEGLLEPEPYARIGTSGMGGNLERHSWFRDINWARLRAGEIASPLLDRAQAQLAKRLDGASPM